MFFVTNYHHLASKPVKVVPSTSTTLHNSLIDLNLPIATRKEFGAKHAFNGYDSFDQIKGQNQVGKSWKAAWTSKSHYKEGGKQ